MSLTKIQKKYIRENIEGSTATRLASKLGVKKKLVDKYIVSAGLSEMKKKKKIKKKEKIPYIKLNSFKNLISFWIRHLDFAAIVIVIVGLVYANSLQGAFISDDIPTYVNNPLTKDFVGSLKTLRLTQIIHAANYYFFGDNPLPSHVVSQLLHVFAGLLGFTVLSNFFSKKVSMFATLLFLVHPVNTEAVSWISGRVYPLIAIYTFLSMIFYIMYKNSKKWIYLIVTLFIFTFAMATTRMAQVLIIPLIIFVLDQFLMNYRLKIKEWINLAPFLLLSGGYVYYIYSQGRLVSRIQETAGTTLDKATPYLTRFGYSIYKAVVLLFYPVHLSLYHDAETITPTKLRLMFIVSTALIIFIIFLWKKNRKAAGLSLIGIASIIYMLSPYQVSWFIAERYLYIASLCFLAIVVATYVKLDKKFKHASLIITILLFGIYSTRVIARNMDWKTRRTLWESTRNAYPKSARTYNNLGDVYAEDGEMDKAVEAFEKALELNPTYADALHNLGFTYLRMEDIEKAGEYFEKTIAINPNIPQAYYHLGIVKYEQGDFQASLEQFEKALEISPEYENAKTGVVKVKAVLEGYSL